jgi:hypothetical protein
MQNVSQYASRTKRCASALTEVLVGEVQELRLGPNAACYCDPSMQTKVVRACDSPLLA